MTAGDVLQALLDRGIQLWKEGRELRLRAPRNALTPELTEELREWKPEILDVLGSGRKIAPLSFAQERLWFLHRLEPADTSYTVMEAWRVRGRLDPEALRRALGELVARHESLRTRFAALDGRGVQAIRIGAPAVAFSRVDLGAVPAEVRRGEAAKAASELAAGPPDLESGPPFTVVLFALEPAEHFVVFKLHHLLADGWSLGILRREVVELYAAAVEGRRPDLDELPIQYADFAVRQRQELAGERLAQLLGYWRRRLADLTELRLPSDRPRRASPTRRGAVLDVGIPEMWTELARRRSVEAGTSLYMVLLAAFTALLQRYAHQDDVVAGTPIASRNRGEIEGLIGFFVNTLVMRVDLAGDPDGRELLRRTRETALGAYAHQDLPFEVLVDDLQPRRDLGRNPLFQVSFALQNAPEPEPQPPGLAIVTEHVGLRRAHFDLELHLHESPRGLDGLLVYHAELFDKTTMRRFARHFERLLVAFAVRPDRRVSEAELLAPHERHQLLSEWNAAPAGDEQAMSAMTAMSEMTWPRLFARQAERTPDAVAAVDESATLSYRGLAEIVRRRSLALRALGVGPERRVALVAERSVAFLAEALAVLEAGGAYVPVEGGGHRRSYVLTDSEALELSPVLEEVGPVGPVGPGVSPENAAYVIYTSGSSGRPKGVVVEHRQLAAYVRAIARVVPGASRTAPATGFATDLAHTMIFPVLASGGRVLVARSEVLESGEKAARFFGRRPVDLLKTVPSHLGALVEARRAARLLPLRRTILGGEALSWELARRLRELAPEGAVVNHYGPTETTVGVATYDVGAADPRTATVPVGRPLPGSAVVLADRRLRPVPAGVHGEIVVGGAQVARGYLRRPALTAVRFVADPFGRRPGARLYRTGDRARQLADGVLEFLGRFDRQVKVRGFRVEPGEIEAVLKSHPGVRDAVVAWRPEARCLAAFYVGGATAGEVGDFLRGRLPAPMIPSSIERLDELPLTSAGKVDPEALARRAAAETASAAAPAPRTPTETALAEIWKAVLEVPCVGVDQSFFELGGHSLLGTRVLSRIERTFRVELPLRSLFEGPTVAQLAGAVDRALESGAGFSLPPIVPASRRGPPPLSWAQQRLYFLDRLAPSSAAYNMPAVLRLAGRLDAAALRRSLEEIVRRHETLRTTFAETGGVPRQVVSAEVRLPWTAIDLGGLGAGERLGECDRLAEEDARRPFDLARGPLVRAKLLGLGDREHRLLLVLHHIVSDGWSHGVLHRELTALYPAYSAGRESPLPELPVQYADYAVWQRRWLAGEAFAERLERVVSRLAGAAPLELTPDRPRSRTPTGRGAAVGFAVPRATAASLERLAAAERVSLFMTLAASFMALLHRVTGGRQAVLGSPIAQRNRREIENLIGFFVNMIVLRAGLSPRRRFTELLAEVRESALDAYAHQSLPFERLVEGLAAERHPGRNPVFQIAFALQNAPRVEVALPGLTVERLDPPAAAVRFDLELFTWQDGGELEGAFVFSTELFDPTTIRRLAGHFGNVLAGIAAAPRIRLGELDPWTAAEAHQVLLEWNDRGVPEAKVFLVHQVFAEAARRRPGAALVFEGRRLGYRELDRRAERLAAELAALGVGPESRVGILAERSFEMAVALLGVLKAGAAFVPLDPELPQDRQEFLLRDSGAEVVLTCRESRLEVSRTGIVRPGAPGRSPTRAEADPLNAAYVVYTSGSTGRPKGVVVTHRGLAHHMAWMRRVHPLGPRDRLVQKTPLSFDVALWETFWALTSGADLVLARPGGHLEPAYLVELVRRERITVLHFVPSMLPVFLDEPGVRRLRSLARVVCGGEELPAELVERFRELLPAARLDNFYGPSEVTIGATGWRCDPRRSSPRVPIGPGIDNVRTYLLGPGLSPVASGMAGELHAGGPQLARGYLGRPRLTAAAFVPDPFSAEPGERLYATGDLARQGPDGVLEFLGRRDLQVQIHGARVELGEIEAVLAGHEAVRETVVAVDESSRLVAGVVVSDELRREWSERQVSHWREVYDALHAPGPRAAEADPDPFFDSDPFFDVAGWNDSYTGAPIPPEEMRDWLDATVARILELEPRRVLEIGCGNGLVLARVAPAAAEYVGTDFSAAALAVLRERIERSGRAFPRLRLLEREADDFTGLGDGAFDTVIVNSVVQYFPGVDYLVRVVEGAVRAVGAGGSVFLGDVRSRSLQDALSASVELFRAPASLPLPELGARIRRRRLHEEELLVDPAFFPALARRSRRIRGARVLPKRGRFANELTRFRYDVVLHVGDGAPAPAAEVQRLDWRRDDLDAGALQRRLEIERPAVLVVTDVPNPRLAIENRLLELLDAAAGPATAGDLEAELLRTPAEGQDPDELEAVAGDLSYAVEPSWAAGRTDGSFDAVFRRSDVLDPLSGQTGDDRPAGDGRYANDPLLGKIARQLEPRLQEHLRRRLPAPMVPSAILLLDSLPHLRSGKVDRAALREVGAALARDRGRPHLKEAYAPPRTPSEKALARVWSELLDLDRTGVRDNFFQLGGDSILGIRIVSRAREAGLEVRLKDLFEHQTIAELARLADSRTTGRAPRRDPVTGPVPLTPIQRWFFEREMAEPWHFNQSVLLASGARPAVVEQALGHLLRHHDMLRASFQRDRGEWRQSVALPGGPAPFARVDLSRLGADRRRAEISRVTARLQASFDLTEGPLWRAAFLDPDRLFLAVHHLVVDRVSWPVLLEDLESACRRIGEGRPVELPARTTSFREWAELLVRHAGSAELRRELPLWRDLLAGADPGIPVDREGPNIRASVASCSSVLSVEETRKLLHDVPAAFGTRVTDPLLVALVRALAGWTGRRSLLVELEGHGREELFEGVDLSRTVGWFTSAFPVFLDLEEVRGDEEALAAVRERLRALPHHGLGYGLLRYLSGQADVANELRSLPRPRVRLNYMGRIEAASRALFEFAGDPEGPHASPRQERGFLLELNGYVVGGELRVDWLYSRNLHRRATVERLARSFEAELRRIAGLNPPGGGRRRLRPR